MIRRFLLILSTVAALFAPQTIHGMTCAQDSTTTMTEVVVTGTGTQHSLRDVPVHTEVINRQMLDSFGGKSVEEILGSLTSSFAFNEGDMGSQMQMGGLGNAYILVLVDGKRLHGDVGGENDLGLIDPQNIERIEIVRGAQSALYGSDAMAGVVNIITRRHADAGWFAENTTRYGMHNDVRQHNSLAWNRGRWGLQTNAQVQHSGGWQNTAEEYTEGHVVDDSRNMTVNRYTNWQLHQHVTYALRPRLSLYADGTYYSKGIHRPQHGRYPSCDVYTYDLRYRNASASVGGKWTLRERDAVTVDVDWNKHAYYYDYTARTYEYVHLVGEQYGDLDGEWYSVPMYRGQSKLQSDQQRAMAQARGVFYLPQGNTLNGGVEYRYDYLHAPERTDDGGASDWTTALYVQDEFSKLPWLNVTAGARLVGNECYGVRLTPKVSTMFSLGDFRLRIGWSQGFKTPTVKELHYRYLHVMGSSTFFNIGNTDLHPQTNNYYSANVEYRGSRFTASVSAYLNRLDDMIALVNVPVGEIPSGITNAYLGDGSSGVQARMYRNMEDARTRGVDVSLSYQVFADLKLSASYSLLDTDAHMYDTGSGHLHSVIIDGTAHHRWSAQAVYGHRFGPVYRLGLNLSTRGSSTRYYQNNGNGAPYQLWRLNTTHEFARKASPVSYRLEVGVDNLLGYVDRTMHPYHLGTNTPGRTVYAAVSIRFQRGKKISTNLFTNQNTNKDEED